MLVLFILLDSMKENIMSILLVRANGKRSEPLKSLNLLFGSGSDRRVQSRYP